MEDIQAVKWCVYLLRVIKHVQEFSRVCKEGEKSQFDIILPLLIPFLLPLIIVFFDMQFPFNYKSFDCFIHTASCTLLYTTHEPRTHNESIKMKQQAANHDGRYSIQISLF